MPGILFAVVAVGGLFLLAQSSSKGQTKTPSGGVDTSKGAAPDGAVLQLGSDTGQTWTPISPFADPGARMAVASATLLGLSLLKSTDATSGSLGLLGSEVMLILQGSEKHDDQIAKPLVAVTGKITKVYAMAGASVDTVDVLVDAIVNQNSDASKLPKTALPNLGKLRISALQVAAKTG